MPNRPIYFSKPTEEEQKKFEAQYNEAKKLFPVGSSVEFTDHNGVKYKTKVLNHIVPNYEGQGSVLLNVDWAWFPFHHINHNLTLVG